MASVKISALPALPSAALTDLYPTVQGGVTYKGLNSQLVSLFNANLSFLPLAGGTMTGALNMGGFQINDMADPTLAQDAATKNYVDTVAQGLNILKAAQAASTTNLNATYANGTAGVGATLTNAGSQAAFAIDSYTASLNDRILIKNQSTTYQNGVYTVTTLGSNSTNWILTRALDYDTAAQINPGDFITVDNGGQAATGWIETAVVATIGTDAITFSSFGQTIALPVSLANGGTGANITAAANKLVYSGASTFQLLATANNAILVTNGSGVPSLGTALPAGVTVPAGSLPTNCVFVAPINSQSVANGGSDVKIVLQTATVNTGTLAVASSVVTLTNAGQYRISLLLSPGVSATNSVTLSCKIKQNSTIVGNYTFYPTVNNQTLSSIYFSTIITASANDTITWFFNNGDSGSITIAPSSVIGQNLALIEQIIL